MRHFFDIYLLYKNNWTTIHCLSLDFSDFSITMAQRQYQWSILKKPLPHICCGTSFYAWRITTLSLCQQILTVYRHKCVIQLVFISTFPTADTDSHFHLIVSCILRSTIIYSPLISISLFFYPATFSYPRRRKKFLIMETI